MRCEGERGRGGGGGEGCKTTTTTLDWAIQRNNTLGEWVDTHTEMTRLSTIDKVVTTLWIGCHYLVTRL